MTALPASLPHRRIGSLSVSAIGLGCMSLSHAYGSPPPVDVAKSLLAKALDLGIDFFDTAALYGFGANEELVGPVLKPHRQRIVLASKCGLMGVNGKRVLDGRPEAIKASCEASLRRLQTDVIDLFYLHRRDFSVPIEESVGALADLVRAGKVRHIGLSEISGATLRKAHAVHPIAAVQNEYSLWTREPEIGLLPACRELGTALVAFSPLARAYLTGRLTDPSAQLEKGDIRHNMPRFSAENYPRNLGLLPPYRAIAERLGSTMAQLALAWVLARGDDIVPIPGTTSASHLEEDVGAVTVRLDAATMAELDRLISNQRVAGNRYNDATQKEIDTETFA